MDNQHRKISGYRELTQEEIDLMNEIKQKGKELGDLIEKISSHVNNQTALEESKNAANEPSRIHAIDQAEPYRWIAMARTDFQVGIMKLVRAVAQPTDGM